MRIAKDRVIFSIISLILSIFLWRYVKIEKLEDCRTDQNSHEDCQEVIKRLE